MKTNKIKTGKSRLLIIALAVFVCAVSCAASSCGVSVSSSSGNSSNFGFVLVDGDDVYYTKAAVNMETFEFFSNIYKYNSKTDSDTLVSSMKVDYISYMNAFLSLDGGYLYFLPKFVYDTDEEYGDNIYRVKPDGKNTEPEKLFEENIKCTFMHISNGTIYYYDDADSAFYRMNTNGSNKKLLCEAYADAIAFGGDKIYFVDYEILMAVSVNGGEPEEIYDFDEDEIYIESLVFDGNYLYYLDDEYATISRIKTDGTDIQEVYKLPESSYAYIERFNISGGTVYFILDYYGKSESYAVLSVIPGNSRSTKEIVTDSLYEFLDIGPIQIWGDIIYFVGMPADDIMDSDDVWFTVKKSGGKPSAFKPFVVFE